MFFQNLLPRPKQPLHLERRIRRTGDVYKRQSWGYEYIGDTRTVDVHVKRLREKIKDHANWSLATVWGIGYKFEVRD